MREHGRDLRVDDSEREQALTLLGKHFTAGRLDVHEYDRRCGQVAAATYRSEITSVFHDLPSLNSHGDASRSAPARRYPNSTLLAYLGAGIVLFVLVVATEAWILPLVAIAIVLWIRRSR